MSKIYIDAYKCIHCGACTSVCKNNALTIDKTKYTLSFNEEKCIGCERCIDACPLRAIAVRVELRWLCV